MLLHIFYFGTTVLITVCMVLTSIARNFYSTLYTIKHKMAKVDTTERLRELRELMKLHSLQAYLIPSEDAHQVRKMDERKTIYER